MLHLVSRFSGYRKKIRIMTDGAANTLIFFITLYKNVNCPLIVASRRHTCAVILLSNQHHDKAHL